MALNAEWHIAHPMPPRATFEQRAHWHLEHREACACRPIPAKLAAQNAGCSESKGDRMSIEQIHESINIRDIVLPEVRRRRDPPDISAEILKWAEQLGIEDVRLVFGPTLVSAARSIRPRAFGSRPWAAELIEQGHVPLNDSIRAAIEEGPRADPGDTWAFLRHVHESLGRSGFLIVPSVELREASSFTLAIPPLPEVRRS